MSNTIRRSTVDHCLSHRYGTRPQALCHIFPSMAASWSRVLPSASFFQSLRRSSYTYPASEGLLTSSTFNIINPRHHVVATDNVSEIVSAKDVSGLDDEKILALFTCGFFGGFVFAPERWVLGMGAGSLLPARYTGELCFTVGLFPLP